MRTHFFPPRSLRCGLPPLPPLAVGPRVRGPLDLPLEALAAGPMPFVAALPLDFFADEDPIVLLFFSFFEDL